MRILFRNDPAEGGRRRLWPRCARAAGVAALAVTAAACGLGAQAIPETRYFVIDYIPVSRKKTADVLPVTVGVDSFRSDSVYRSDRIIFRKVPFRVDFYPYERWGARPEEMVTDRLLEHLQASGRFRDVVRASAGVPTDYLVRGRVKRFEEVDKPGGVYAAVAQLDISLLDRASGDVILQRRLTRSTQAKKRPVQGFVDAMAENLRAMLDDASDQIARAVKRHRLRRAKRP